MKNIFTFSIDHPKLVITLVVLISVFFLFQFPKVKIDTDPENMLDRNEPVRLVHNEMKETFDLHDMIVVGIFREDGVYTGETLTRIVAITDEIKEIDGVLDDDVIALGDSRFRVRLVGSSVVERAAKGNNGAAKPVVMKQEEHPPDEINIEETESSQRWRIADQAPKKKVSHG